MQDWRFGLRFRWRYVFYAFSSLKSRSIGAEDSWTVWGLDGSNTKRNTWLPKGCFDGDEAHRGLVLVYSEANAQLFLLISHQNTLKDCLVGFFYIRKYVSLECFVQLSYFQLILKKSKYTYWSLILNLILMRICDLLLENHYFWQLMSMSICKRFNEKIQAKVSF